MGRKTAFGASFLAGYMMTRQGHRQAAAESAAQAAADEAAWQQAHARMEQEAALTRQAAAEAARDEARHQGLLARRATWMSQDPVGQAWREATNPGGADERLARLVEERNLSWRQSWARQCAADGLSPVAPPKVGGVSVIQPLMSVVLPLLGVAAVLFVLNAIGWAWNHSPFTPETQGVRLDEESGGAGQVPRRGTRQFWTPGLAIGGYVASGLALLAYAFANALDLRAVRALRRAGAEAQATNEDRARQRVGRYGFDPLAAKIPGEAQWAVLPDGTDPEAALHLLRLEDPRRASEPERMSMAHVERMQAVAAWGGTVRTDTPAALPAAMASELERMRAR